MSHTVNLTIGNSTTPYTGNLPSYTGTSIAPTTNGTLVWDNGFYYQNDFNYNPFSNLYYSVKFGEDLDNILSSNIKSIKKNKFIFECNYVGNRIQPYEFIMKLIDKNKKFSVNIKVSDILTINYINLQFTEIVNNLNFNNNCCDFSRLKVKFKYEKILYENHKLSEKELRTEKLKKIIDNQ